jgi:NAD(P) transhydrogenase subunit beta
MKLAVDLVYLFAILSFIVGLKYLSYPSKAREGNAMAGVGMTLAILATTLNYYFAKEVNINLILIIIAVGIGTIWGKRMANRAEMTEMPQLVSLFNALGGGCALLLGLIEAQQIQVGGDRIPQVVLLSGMIIGATSFTGSIVAYYKLAGKKLDTNGTLIVMLSRITLLSLFAIPTLVSLQFFQISLPAEALILGGIALLYGVVFVLPIGGADMPVVISLLNSLTGVATALAGILYGNVLMIAGGILVGAAGILLTLLMCKAMNRSLWSVLSGKFKGTKQIGTGSGEELDIRSITMGEFTTQMAFASKVGIIPGYGLAVAQAQHICSQLVKTLESKDVEVHYIIHPVAGRMPGHMNVLLAEADVPYEQLREMEEVNHDMKSYDLVIVIGANDVVNPAAEKDENSPIYGMPIIKAYDAKQVVVIKRGMSKGYAGVENSLFGEPNCRMVFADAKAALNEANIELKRIV